MFDEQAEAEPLFDLVVIDEAHHLRNPATQSNTLARLIQPIAQHVLFLSATPIHLRNRDLFSLLQLVDPETFRDERVLEDIIQANAGLIEARKAVLGGADAEDLTLAASADGQQWPQIAADLNLALVSGDLETEVADHLRARFLEAEALRKADLSDRAEMQLATLDRRVAEERRRLEELVER